MVISLTLLLAQESGKPDQSVVVLLMLGVVLLGMAVLALLLFTARTFRRISTPDPTDSARLEKKTKSFEEDWWRKPLVPEVKPQDKHDTTSDEEEKT